VNLKTVRSYLFQVHNATVPLLRISIADALFGKTQQAVLDLLFGQPERSFYLRELVAAAGSGASQVQKELSQLAAAGLVTRERKGNQVWFRANPASPVFAELKSIVAKTSGIADVVRAALVPLAMAIEIAFIYGSVARGEHDAASDIDLLVVGTVAPSRLAPIQLALGERLGRPVRPVVYSADELREHAQQREHFIASVLSEPKIWLVGSETQLAELIEQRTRQPRRRKSA
jgi:predicted nucleotidyltransferase